MSKSVKIILSVAAAAALIAVAVVFGGGWIVARQEAKAPAKLPGRAVLAPETVTDPGAPARAVLELRLPWGNAVTEAAADAGENTVVSGPTAVTSAWRWGYRIWRVEATLRPLGTSGMTPGRIRLTLEKPLPGAPDGRFEVEIPALSVSEAARKEAAEPGLAAPEKIAGGGKWWIYAICAAVLLIAGVLIWHNSRHPRPELQPWDIALLDIAELKVDMTRRDFDTEEGVARLSDILRRYLTARFDLPAVTGTGDSFLAGDAAEKLAPDDRGFLRSFLADADLVKFARNPADRTELERSAAAVEALISRTIPPPEPRGKRKRSKAKAKS